MAAAIGAAGVAQAGPGDGIKLGRVTLSPYVTGSVTHDDNAKLIPSDRDNFTPPNNEEEDTYTELGGGIDASFEGDTLSVRGSLFGQDRTYNDLDDLNGEIWGQSLSATIDSGKTRVSFNEAYREVQDTDVGGGALANASDDDVAIFGRPYDSGVRGERSILQAGLGVYRPLSDKMDLGARYSVTSLDYDAPLLDDQSSDGQSVSLNLSHDLTDKLDGLVQGSYTRHDQDGVSSHQSSYTAQAGVSYQQSDKVMVRVAAGITGYERKMTADDELSTASFDVTAAWAATDRTSLALSAGNAYVPTQDNNVKLSTLVGLSAVHRIGERVSVSASATYRQEEFEDDVDTDITSQNGGAPASRTTIADAETEQVLVDAGIRIRAANFATIFANISLDNTNSDLINYETVRTSIGARLQY